MAHDISLLKLHQPAQLNRHVGLACLPGASTGSSGQVPDDKICWVTGNVMLLVHELPWYVIGLVTSYESSGQLLPERIASPPGWDASPSQVTSQHFVRFLSQFVGTHLYSWVERGSVRVKCLAQDHNTMTRPGLEPGPLDPESSALTTRAPRLPLVNSTE